MRSSLAACVGASAVTLATAISPSRSFLDAQKFKVDSFELVDFSAFPEDAAGVVGVAGTLQGSRLGIAVQTNAVPSFGTYALSPPAALALSGAILELPEVPEADATVLPPVSFPAPTITGSPGDAAPASPATLPTVLDLFRSGARFVLSDLEPAVGGYGDAGGYGDVGAADPTPDSTQLFFSQFIVHVPDGVYAMFEVDGIPYVANNIDFGTGNRICFINSILLLRSCNGFAEDPHAVLCCSKSACRGYSQAEYEDLGFDIAPEGTLPDLQCAETDPAFESAPPPGLPTGPSIPGDQPPLAVAAVRMADFSTYPGADGATPRIELDETDVGRVAIRSFQTDILPGAFSLSSSEAAVIAGIVADLPEVPAEEAEVVDVVDFPGIEVRGTTVGRSGRRVATVYSPFHAGFRAALVAQMDAETTVFNLSNMTLLVANSTYQGLGESGLLNFFGLQNGQMNDVLCVQNSVFVLASCEGFRQAAFDLWCCNQVECNREFTTEFLLSVGAISAPLEPLTCVEIGA
eukprot:jgi/Ulvmu1/11966/UM082_0045.1